MKLLIYGGNGWIGKQFIDFLGNDINYVVFYGKSRVDNEYEIEQELIDVKPDRIILFIGRTHGPGFNTIDYLEQKGKLHENIRDNLFAPVCISLIAKKYKIHLTYLGTGCIFNGYPDNGYLESDVPDFFGSSYSVVKGFTDRIMHLFENDTANNVLNLRIRMPISDDNNSRNFITKIMSYKKICNMPNSMSVLPSLFPIMIDLIKNGTTGTFNMTNPGLISHNEILQMVKETINSDFTWENFTLEEQSKILLSDRSNNYLNTSKLFKLYPSVPDIKDAVKQSLIKMKNKIN